MEQLQKINEIRKAETENGLLKEALAISNEKCNGLISKQNMLIADLTTSVNEIKSDNSFYLKRQSENVQSAVKEIREITQDERKFKTEVSQTIKSEIGRTVAEAKAHALEQVDETLSEIKEQLRSPDFCISADTTTTVRRRHIFPHRTPSARRIPSLVLMSSTVNMRVPFSTARA